MFSKRWTGRRSSKRSWDRMPRRMSPSGGGEYCGTALRFDGKKAGRCANSTGTSSEMAFRDCPESEHNPNQQTNAGQPSVRFC